MNKAEAKRQACRVASLLIQNYLDVGQPGEQMALAGMDEHHPDTKRMYAAFEALRDELERRSDDVDTSVAGVLSGGV